MSGAAPQLPALFALADASAGSAQRTHFRYLLLLGVVSVAAAVAGTSDLERGGLDLAGLAAAVLFLAQLLVLLVLALGRHDETWYEARAAAESLRTLSWRFAVGGEPFPVGTPDAEAARELASRSRTILREMQGPLHAAAGADEGLPASIWQARAGGLADRRQLYLQQRLRAQQDWYEGKARRQRRASRRLLGVMMAVSLLGVVAGVLQSVVALHLRVDGAGVCAALVGALLGYLQARQYSVQARAYLLTSHELALLRHTCPEGDDEAVWAEWVASAEEAMSREHTMWLASHGRAVLQPG